MDPKIEGLIDQGDLGGALALATERLNVARASGSDVALAEALIDEARAQLAHGDRDEAVMTVDEAISRARRSCGATDARYAEALELGAEIAAEADMPNTADARFRSAIEILDGAGVSGAPLATALLHHGLFRRDQGETEAALRAFSSVVERTGEVVEARAEVATAITEMGYLVLADDRDDMARQLGDRALELFLELGRARRVGVADAMALVGIAALRQGEPAVATDFLETACDVYRGCKGALPRHPEAAHQLGRSLAAQGKLAEARAALLATLDLYREGSEERMTIEQELLELAREPG